VTVAAQTYRELLPPAELSAYVSLISLQHVADDGPAYKHRSVSDGGIEIRASLREGTIDLIGPHHGPRVDNLAPGAMVIGVRLHPGAAAILGTPADEITDRQVPLEAFWGRAAGRLADQLAEKESSEEMTSLLAAAFKRQARSSSAADPLAAELVGALQRDSTGRIDEIARDLFVSPRQLRRRCLHALGYGPKTLQRLLRFQRYLALSQLHRDVGIASLAIEAGYADQSHLTHEAVQLAGVPPAKLLAETRSDCGPNHDHRVSFIRFQKTQTRNPRS
jgi:AraC-like DNA-binding protein